MEHLKHPRLHEFLDNLDEEHRVLLHEFYQEKEEMENRKKTETGKVVLCHDGQFDFKESNIDVEASFARLELLWKAEVTRFLGANFEIVFCKIGEQAEAQMKQRGLYRGVYPHDLNKWQWKLLIADMDSIMNDLLDDAASNEEAWLVEKRIDSVNNNIDKNENMKNDSM